MTSRLGTCLRRVLVLRINRARGFAPSPVHSSSTRTRRKQVNLFHFNNVLDQSRSANHIAHKYIVKRQNTAVLSGEEAQISESLHDHIREKLWGGEKNPRKRVQGRPTSSQSFVTCPLP